MYVDIAALNYLSCVSELKAAKVVSALRRTITIEDTTGLNVMSPGESHMILQFSYDEDESLLMLTERITCETEEDIANIRERLELIDIEGFYLSLEVSDFKEYIDINLIDNDVYNNAIDLYGGQSVEEEII